MAEIKLFRRTYRIQGGKILQSSWSTSKCDRWETTLKWEEKMVDVDLGGIKKEKSKEKILFEEFLRQTDMELEFEKFRINKG